ERPFDSRDRAGNVWWLAALSMGESWHNLHHADPTCARTGVLKGQIDSGARVIQLFESLGWAYDVRWPRPERLEAGRVAQRAGAGPGCRSPWSTSTSAGRRVSTPSWSTAR